MFKSKTIRGVDYLMGDHWLVNAEVKYQIISHADQVVFGIGASYRFKLLLT